MDELTSQLVTHQTGAHKKMKHNDEQIVLLETVSILSQRIDQFS